MIDEYALSQMILTVFMPYVPTIAGFVLAILTALMLYLAFRDLPGGKI
jgi:hypothetical protein